MRTQLWTVETGVETPTDPKYPTTKDRHGVSQREPEKTRRILVTSDVKHLGHDVSSRVIDLCS